MKQIKSKKACNILLKHENECCVICVVFDMNVVYVHAFIVNISPNKL